MHENKSQSRADLHHGEAAMSAMITLPIVEYDKLKKASAKEYSRGYQDGLATASRDFAEVNAHKNELLRCVEALEGLLAEERSKNGGGQSPSTRTTSPSTPDMEEVSHG